MANEDNPLLAEYERRKREQENPVLAEYEATRPTRRDALAPIAQGASLGFADEILGAIEGARRKWHGGSYREGYEEGRDKVRNVGQRFADENPKTNLALEIAGGLATGGAGAVRAGAVRTGARVANAAKVGAGYGAVAGVGTTEGGLSDRAAGATFGALLGAGAGAAVPAVTTAARRGTQALARGVRKIPAVQQRLPASQSLDPSERKLADLMLADEVAPTKVRDVVQRAGDEGMLVDAGGPNVRRAAKYISAKPGREGSKMTSELMERTGREDAAVRSSVQSKLGSKSADQATQELEERLSTEAAPLYNAAFKQSVQITPKLWGLIDRPAIKSALRTARATAANEGAPFPADGSMDVRTIDYVKRAMDDRISSLLRSGKKDKARVLRNLRRDLLEEIDASVPEYKQARAAYAGPARSREAIRNGQNFLKKEPEDLKRYIAKLTPADSEFYRLGVKQKVMSMLDTGGKNRSRAAKLDEPRVLNRLKAILNPDEYAEIEQEIQNRIMFRQTQQGVTGGSDTVPKLLAGADVEGINPEQVIRAVTEPKQALLSAAISALKRRQMGVTGQKAERLAQLLRLHPNDPKFLDLMARIEAAERKAKTPQSTLGRTTSGAFSRALAIGAGGSQ